MKYYVLYENDSDYELNVVDFDLLSGAVTFIEERINEHGYHLSDFSVIQGVELSLKAVTTPVKVLLTNSS